jgi:3-hydroxyisobutyrate dehydrogenase-like beta-hydroxyacid dehydrogenase
MAQEKYPTAFPLKHAQKDMRLALLEADNKGISLPVSPKP